MWVWPWCISAAEIIQCYRWVTLKPTLSFTALCVNGSRSHRVSLEGKEFCWKRDSCECFPFSEISSRAAVCTLTRPPLTRHWMQLAYFIIIFCLFWACSLFQKVPEDLFCTEIKRYFKKNFHRNSPLSLFTHVFVHFL